MIVTQNSNCSPNFHTQDLVFQLLDLDYVKDRSDLHEEFTIHAFGVTDKGNSVHMRIAGVQPYFFIDIPQAMTEQECSEFVRRLNHKIKTQSPIPGQINIQQYTYDFVKSAKSVRKKSIWGYRKDDSDFLQIFCANPEGVRRAVSILRHWDASLDMPACFRQGATQFHIFEANVDPITRIATSTEIVISGWVRVRAGEYDASEDRRTSWCDIDVTAQVKCIRPASELESVAPFLIGSFDIECVPEGGRGFPDPNKPLDRCVQIGTAVYRFGEQKPCANYVMALDTVDNVEGVTIKYFKTEEELLLAWRDLVRVFCSCMDLCVCVRVCLSIFSVFMCSYKHAISIF
jgi:DNA polymerase delta subunit 1